MLIIEIGRYEFADSLEPPLNNGVTLVNFRDAGKQPFEKASFIIPGKIFERAGTPNWIVSTGNLSGPVAFLEENLFSIDLTSPGSVGKSKEKRVE